MTDKKDQEQLESLKKENEQLKKDAEVQFDRPYKCLKCGDRVNFTFIMPMFKNSGLCPNCYNED